MIKLAGEEVSLCVLKPDACERGLENQIVEDIQKAGFETMCFVKKVLTEEEIGVLYLESKDQVYYKDIVKYFTRGPVVFFLVKKENAIDDLNKLVGSTNPLKADEGTLRKKYGQNILENTIHSSNENRLLDEIKKLYTVDTLEDIITFPCYFKLKNDTLCHTVAENCYEDGKIIGIPKYFRTNDDIFNVRYFDGKSYFRTDSYMESILYAKLFDVCEVRKVDKYDEEICVFDMKDVVRVYNPFVKSIELYNYDGDDKVLLDAKEILHIMTNYLEIPLKDIGIEGSILLEGHKPNSDIDIVVKNVTSIRKLKSKFNTLSELSNIKLYNSDDCKLIFSRRKKYKSFTSVNEMIEQEKKRTVGLINGRRFWMQPILGSNVLEMENRKVSKIGNISLDGLIIDDSYSYLWPSYYKFKDNTGICYKIECYDPIYMNQAMLGDHVHVEAPIYKNKETGEQIVVLSPWNDDVQVLKLTSGNCEFGENR